ncbi:MAG: hypothetical protein QM737_18600 [Ferruginibacter sp.]
MTAISFTLIVALCGLLAVTSIDAFGSIISRKLNFNYGWFIILSIVVYTGAPFVLSQKISFEIALTVNFIIGIFDATVGHMISKKLKANVGVYNEKHEASILMRLFTVLFVAFILGYLGYVLGK